MAKVHFFSEGILFKVAKPRKTAKWVEFVARKEKAAIHSINYIFCSDSYLLNLNREYLNHSTLTDIITFDYGSEEMLEGEIYISVDRIRENANIFEVPFDTELARVMIHGVLHLLGYKDKTPTDKALMRKKEEAYLSLLK
jgi:probable rRNA maturation factor